MYVVPCLMRYVVLWCAVYGFEMRGVMVYRVLVKFVRLPVPLVRTQSNESLVPILLEDPVPRVPGG